jgi:hypothetical protein
MNVRKQVTVKSILRILAPLAMAVTSLSATPAFASSDWCFTDLAPPVFSTHCETLRIPANASRHFIFFSANAFTHYQLLEGSILIRDGNTGSGTHTETVFGLFGTYSIAASGPGSVVYISNT